MKRGTYLTKAVMIVRDRIIVHMREELDHSLTHISNLKASVDRYMAEAEFYRRTAEDLQDEVEVRHFGDGMTVL